MQRGGAKHFIAYCGRYEENEENATVTHTVEVALFPNWIGVNQVRMVEFDGDLARSWARKGNRWKLYCDEQGPATRIEEG